ncbi:hypothetical protein [Sphingobacterium thalpophilum]|uniref:hypothetical protein n=1 Tax=Sphingobacterium thalpophilum TaxID=259 RepID=UPI003D95F2BF
MKFKNRTISQLAEVICGNQAVCGNYFPYRTSSIITKFFHDAETEYSHDGSTRNFWVANTLTEILNLPSSQQGFPSDTFLEIIKLLMDPAEATNEDSSRSGALAHLNDILSKEGFEAFYAEDRQCYLKQTATQKIGNTAQNPHRTFTPAEQKRKENLTLYLNNASEDDIIEEILIPLFRHLGFFRITNAGHKDKALEYGKDIWMKYTLPTQHILYFGIQVKKGRIDSSGVTKTGNANVAEIYNQVLMMLGHEIFDPEIGKKVLVDHGFIVAGGEITKAARNWIGGKLDVTKRSQIMFIDREDILNLYIVNGLPLPAAAIIEMPNTDDLPF